MIALKKIIITIFGLVLTIVCLYLLFVYQKNSIDYLQKSEFSEWENQNVATLASFKIGQTISKSKTPWCKNAPAPCLVEKSEYYKSIGISTGVATTRLGWNEYLSEYKRPSLERPNALGHSPDSTIGEKEWIVHFNSDTPLPMNGYLPFGVNVTVRTCDGIIEQVTVNHLVAGASPDTNPLYAKAIEWYGAPQSNRVERLGINLKRPKKSFAVQTLESVWNGEETVAIFRMDASEENYLTVGVYSLNLQTYPMKSCSKVESPDNAFILREKISENQRKLDNKLFQ